MSHRQGTTLMEVLVAIFIMGIGTLAIMAMFPLAAVSMARSIRDDRVAHAAANAKAIAIAKSIRFDAKVRNYFNNPGGPNAANLPANTYANAGINNPSWTVFVDPVGVNTYLGLGQAWLVGGLRYDSTLTRDGGIPRVSLSFTNTTTDILSWCTSLDDIAFGPNGQPAVLATTNSFTRNPSPAISYAWMLRRPKTGIDSVCDMTLVVYNQRSLGLGGIQTSARELTYTIVVDPNSPTTAKVVWDPTVPQPQILDGGWILDMTASTKNANTGVYPTPCNAKFYRVVNVGDITTGVTFAGSAYLTGTYNSIPLELATPLQFTPQAPFTITAGPPPVVGMTIAVMDAVIEVIECGDSWRSWNN